MIDPFDQSWLEVPVRVPRALGRADRVELEARGFRCSCGRKPVHGHDPDAGEWLCKRCYLERTTSVLEACLEGRGP